MDANDCLKDCVYFEVRDDEVGITNYYMLIGKRWVRGDDNAVFLPQGIQDFVTQALVIKDKKLTFTFYGKGVNKVVVNG